MNPLVRVCGFDHIVLSTNDVERALAFYCDVLGMPGERVEEWRAGQVPFPSVRVDATTLIDLFARERTGVNLDHFCLVVEEVDLDAVAADERVEVASGPTDGLFGAQGYARSLYIRDPDGNVIELRSY
jgi:catechol 2,3-dioxygenase-like lactoylglutathione lyase family enzyme